MKPEIGNRKPEIGEWKPEIGEWKPEIGEWSAGGIFRGPDFMDFAS